MKKVYQYKNEFRDVMTKIAKILCKSDIKMPNIDEVKAMEKEIINQYNSDISNNDNNNDNMDDGKDRENDNDNGKDEIKEDQSDNKNRNQESTNKKSGIFDSCVLL